ncbi:MAG: hypothetical protein RSJ41_09835 [Clostridia bacterium]
MKNTMKVLVALVLVVVTLMGGVAMAEASKGARKMSVKVAMTNGKDLCFGDTVTLKAIVKGADAAAYTLSWEVKEGKHDWKALGETNATYTFTVTEQNQNFKYRVALITEA